MANGNEALAEDLTLSTTVKSQISTVKADYLKSTGICKPKDFEAEGDGEQGLTEEGVMVF